MLGDEEVHRRGRGPVAARGLERERREVRPRCRAGGVVLEVLGLLRALDTLMTIFFNSPLFDTARWMTFRMAMAMALCASADKHPGRRGASRPPCLVQDFITPSVGCDEIGEQPSPGIANANPHTSYTRWSACPCPTVGEQRGGRRERFEKLARSMRLRAGRCAPALRVVPSE